MPMVAEPLPRRASYADLLALPAHVTGQIIDGELYAHPRPATPHAAAATELAGELRGPFRRGIGGPGGWIILMEPELHLDADVLVPDVAGWRRERMPELPRAAFLTLPPDWVAEVLSPATAQLDRVKKLRKYVEAQVAYYWLVDPNAQTLEVLRFDAGTYKLVGSYAGGEKVRAAPFDAVELNLALLWEM